MNDSATLGDHPYFPLGTALHGYAANTMASSALVACFAAGSGAILATAYSIISRVRPGLGRGDTFAALWFVLCGFIHFFFEGTFSPSSPSYMKRKLTDLKGYFALNYDHVPGQLDLFGQLWKEYSLSDSRYLTQDSFIVTMEAVTAIFWGPLSFAIAYCIVTSHPLRHPLQTIVSLGQLYGDVLYYATCTFAALVQGVHICRPEGLYFWAYYMLCNAFWIVIPFSLIVSSAKATSAAFAQVQAVGKEKKGQ